MFKHREKEKKNRKDMCGGHLPGESMRKTLT